MHIAETTQSYAYTTGNLVNATALDMIAYGYTDANWPDLLTSYDGQEITSDGIGNMLCDGTWTYTWQHGRQLAQMNSGTTQLEFDYNADGLRAVKTLNTDTVTEFTTVYRYDGTNLTHAIRAELDYVHFYYEGND